MQQDEIRQLVLEILYQIAPELQEQVIEPDLNFRDQFDFDSVDFLNFILSLEKKLQLKLPELDYPKLSSLNGCLAYLASRSESD